MKKTCLLIAVLLLSSQGLYRADAVELCESHDYYDLGNAANCPPQLGKPGNKGGDQDAMFGITKSYPFDRRGMVIGLLQRKIELIDNHEARHQIRGQSDNVRPTLAKLEEARRVLLDQLGMVNTATVDNWSRVQEDAYEAMEETTRSFYEAD